MNAVSTPARRPVARRSRYSRHLLGAALMILLGAFLPWVSTALGNVAGVQGAGLWTMYAAMLGVAGAILRSPRWAAGHAAVMGAVAVGLSLWQVLHLVGLVGFSGWMPGPGLVLTIGGGVLALVAATGLLREAR